MDIDSDDGHPAWGELKYYRNGRAKLTIYDTQEAIDRAWYRLTSIRDIWQDNAGWGPEYSPARIRSLERLVEQFIELVGKESITESEFNRWYRNW
jgi:hypothetical protein